MYHPRGVTHSGAGRKSIFHFAQRLSMARASFYKNALPAEEVGENGGRGMQPAVHGADLERNSVKGIIEEVFDGVDVLFVPCPGILQHDVKRSVCIRFIHG